MKGVCLGYNVTFINNYEDYVVVINISALIWTIRQNCVSIIMYARIQWNRIKYSMFFNDKVLCVVFQVKFVFGIFCLFSANFDRLYSVHKNIS